MKRVFTTLFIYLFITCYSLKSQNNIIVDNWVDYLQEMVADSEDPDRFETLYQDLSYLQDHPVNLNEATEELLQKIPFLSDLQIKGIMEYRKRYNNMATIYELKNIPELDFHTINLILPFVYVGEIHVDNYPVTVNNLLKYGSNELIIRYDDCFQQKEGYRSKPDSILNKYPNRSYLGESFYHSLRYSYTFRDKIQAGVVMEKDAGEPFWNSHHKGYDFYSGHLFMKDINRLKALAIGDYKVSFGQGLIISHDYFPGRNAMIVNAERRTNGFRRHYSTNEVDFMRGIATTWNWNRLDVNLFYSRRKLDGKIEGNYITSFQTDGLHRLPRDWEKRKSFSMQTVGGNIRYAIPDMHIGITVVNYSFDNYEWYPEEKPYNLFYFRGKSNINTGVDYMLKTDAVKFFGETAFSGNKKFATLNGLQLTPVSYITFFALYRYYDREYHSFFGNAFSQNSTVQNEQGVYVGMVITPVAYWKVSLYADHFRFPWLKYRVDSPSSGKEYMVQLDHTHRKNFTCYARYKYQQKEINVSEEGNTHSIYPYSRHRLRGQCNYQLKDFSFRTSLEGILYSNYEQPVEKGWLFSQTLSWKKDNFPVQADIYGACFNTDNYNTRLYSYEKSTLYSFYVPSFYGKGMRFSTILKWNISWRLIVSAKLALTHYRDREVIGSGTEEIAGNKKSDINLMLKYKF